MYAYITTLMHGVLLSMNCTDVRKQGCCAVEGRPRLGGSPAVETTASPGISQSNAYRSQNVKTVAP